MQSSQNGAYYENFRNGRIFFNQSKNSLTLKAYKTRKGNHRTVDSWICLSCKNTKPIIYSWKYSSGIRNHTYRRLTNLVDSLLDRVSTRGKKDKVRRNRVRRKLLTLSKPLFGSINTIDSLNTQILRAWLPFLEHYEDDQILEMLSILYDPVVRMGFKKDCFKEAISLWFGSTPKGLIKRIGNLLEQKHYSTFLLVMCCRTWDINHIYTLIDSAFSSGSNILLDGIEISKANTLIKAYSEKRWLTLFEEHFSASTNNIFDNYYCLHDTIAMYNDLGQLNIRLPKRPRSINTLHTFLIDEMRRRRAHELEQVGIPQTYSTLDGLLVGELCLLLPKTGKDLITWGDLLQNCLISRVQPATLGLSSIIGIFQGEQIKYALEIRDGHIQEFLGISNTLPLQEHDQLVREALRTYGIS